jgi:Rieske Fe-S protein
MKRRGFIKNSCTICLAAATAGIMQALESCSPLELYRTEAIDKKINVPLSEFNAKEFLITRIRGEEYDLAIMKKNNGQFDAFQLRCTHADTALIYSGASFTCSMHGSIFDKNGNVTKGPAEQKLRSYRTEINKDTLIVYL